jgi:hypothetical protein
MKLLMVFILSLTCFVSTSFAQQRNFQMIEVINLCIDGVENKKIPEIKDLPDNRTFEAIAKCVQILYSKSGTFPGSQSVKSFYTLLDEIVEDYVKEKITLKKAKAEMVRAWSITVDADNSRQAQVNRAPPPAPSVEAPDNPWARLHEAAKSIDPATNQRRVDQVCYSSCLDQGMSMGLCISKCSY